VTAGCDRVATRLPRRLQRVFEKARTISAPAVTCKWIVKKVGNDARFMGSYLVARNALGKLGLPAAVGASLLSPTAGALLFVAGLPLDLAVLIAREHAVREDRVQRIGATIRRVGGDIQRAARHQQRINRRFLRQLRNQNKNVTPNEE
jgi:hypothetical protein